MTFWTNEPDDFGVPGNTFGSVPERFYGALGRIVALGALSEMQFASLVCHLARLTEKTLAGHQMKQIVERFDKLAEKQSAAGRPLPEEVVAIRIDLKAAMDERNALVHSSWPTVTLELARGWRTVPKSLRTSDDEYVVWTETNIDEMTALIGRLAAFGGRMQRYMNEHPPDLVG